MSPYCKNIIAALEETSSVDDNSVRVIRCWEEEWEKMKVGPSEHAKLEARLVRKYGGLKWLGPDKDEEGNTYTSRTAHLDMMFFQKQHGNN